MKNLLIASLLTFVGLTIVSVEAKAADKRSCSHAFESQYWNSDDTYFLRNSTKQTAKNCKAARTANALNEACMEFAHDSGSTSPVRVHGETYWGRNIYRVRASCYYQYVDAGGYASGAFLTLNTCLRAGGRNCVRTHSVRYMAVTKLTERLSRKEAAEIHGR